MSDSLALSNNTRHHPTRYPGKRFEQLSFEAVEPVRYMLTYFPTVGVLAFYGVLLTDGTVELVDVEIDDDYWETISMDPGADE